MKTYIVRIKINDPFPKEFSYRQPANHPGTAINRAIKKFRAEEFKGKKIKELNINLLLL